MRQQPKILKIRRPDDWHIHLRDGDTMKVVLLYTSEIYGRAIVMPNLFPPITTVKMAISYRKRILNALPVGNSNFTPLMTCYLTDLVNPDEIERGFCEGVFTAAKLYLKNVTTNSDQAVSSISAIIPILERMEKLGMPLLVHGEVSNPDVDIFDREARFIDTVMEPLRNHFQGMKVVFEHITTKEAVEYVRNSNELLAATVTPHHLMFNRNHMLEGGLHPHLYCLPILKRDVHQKAVRELVGSGFKRVFLGTDSAPHIRGNKETKHAYAGCFSAPSALSCYATVFNEMNALQYFEAFCSENGPRFYNLPLNKDFVELLYQKTPVENSITLSNETLIPLLAGETVDWSVKR